MEKDSDYTTALGHIDQLVKNIPLKRDEHTYLLNAVEMLRQRLEKCDKLEMARDFPE